MSTAPPTMSAPPPPPPPTTSGGGKRRGCLIAVVVVVLLLMAACAGGCIYVSRNPGRTMAFGLGMGRDKIIASVSTSATEQQKADFTTEYDAYLEFLRGLQMAQIQSAGENAKKLFTPAEFLGEASKDNQISPDEIERFVELARGARSLVQ